MTETSDEFETAPIATTSRVPPTESESDDESDSEPIATATRVPERD
ncbi:MAG: hypothetical protein ABEI27_11800 [Halobellus sp.]